MGSHGRSNTFRKSANVLAFDGTTSSEALYILPGQAIAGIQASLAVNAVPAGLIRLQVRFSLQYFSGASPSGTGWTGGSWTTFWSEVMAAEADPTARPNVQNGYISEIFRPALELPSPFKSTVLAGATHAKVGEWVSANTHNAAEAANEWDIRGLFTVLFGGADGASFDADVNVQTVFESA